MSKPAFSVPRGMKDIESEEMAKRLWIAEKSLDTLRRYGFMLVEPSAIENLETLEAKSGPSIRNEIYWFEDKAGRKQGLRFDLTIGLARMIANRQDWPVPAKFCAMSNMWRYDEPQFGRYRSFYQWDAEIFGTPEVEADAEVVALSLDLMENLGLNSVEARINSRKLMEGFLEAQGVIERERLEAALRIIDKIQGVTDGELRGNFEKIGLSSSVIDKLLDFARIRSEPGENLESLTTLVGENEKALLGLKDLNKLMETMKALGKSGNCILDLGIVRGIAYYDGIVFEVYDKKSENVGAIAGGGRFDGLCKLYGRDLPATGVAGGIERLLLSLENAKVLPKLSQAPRIFVVAIDDSVRENVLKIVSDLRRLDVNVDYDLRKRSLSKQLEYVDSLGISMALIVGPREVKRGVVKIRDMTERKERELPLDEAYRFISGSV
ncbi:MAG: histidine--tRNA ligase [Candidatus Bathyarchaeia archaeon]